MRRSWAIDKKGNLEEGRAREKAHGDRVTALLAHNGFLYSVSYDGSIKMWDAESMELVMEERNAHDGGRINCAAVGPDGNLYTGGDDKVPPRSFSCAWCLRLLMSSLLPLLVPVGAAISLWMSDARWVLSLLPGEMQEGIA